MVTGSKIMIKAILPYSTYLLCLICFSAFPTHTNAQSDPTMDLLDFVTKAHLATLQSIHTLSCRVEYDLKLTHPVKGQSRQDFTGKFWYSREAVRARVNDRGQESDYVWKNSIKNTLQKSRSEKKWIGASRSKSESQYTPRDALTLAIFAINIPMTIKNLPFEQYVEEAKQVLQVKKEMIHGKEMVMVSLLFEKVGNQVRRSTVDVYFDSSVNYLIRKVVFPNRVVEVVQFKEFKQGIFFPERVENRGLKGETVAPTQFSDIKINQPLPNDIFQLPYPFGLTVRDSLQGINYRVDSLGRPISAEISFITGKGGNSPKPGNPYQGMPTTQEPLFSIAYLVLPISVVLLLVGLIGMGIRSWRNQIPNQ